MATMTTIARWTGKPRRITRTGYLYCNTSYSVYADLNDGSSSAKPEMCIEGFTIYCTENIDISGYSSCFPIKVQITADAMQNGKLQRVTKSKTFKTTDIKNNTVIWTASEPGYGWVMPNDGAATTIEVVVTPESKSGYSAISFTEHICHPYQNPFSVSTSGTVAKTGNLTSIQMQRTVKIGQYAGDSDHYYWAEGEVSFRDGYDKLWLSANVPIEDATAEFSSVYIAPWRDMSQSAQSEYYVGEITLDEFYYTEDFYGNRIKISSSTSEIKFSDDTSPVSSALRPSISGYSTTADKYITDGSTKYYLGGESVIEHTITATYKYGANKRAVSGHDSYGNSSEKQVSAYTYSSVPNNPETSTTGTAVITLTDTRYGKASVNIYVPILHYDKPAAGLSIHRCSVLASGETASRTFKDNGAYNSESTVFKADEDGTFCAIELTPEITALRNKNAKSAKIEFSVFSGGTRSQYVSGKYEYTPSAYTGETKCIVIDAPTENSFKITATVTDSFFSGVNAAVISTAGVLMDFLNEGKGVAFGKVAENSNMVDISPNWDIRAFKITIANYNEQSASEVDLVSWMRDIEQRIANLSS